MNAQPHTSRPARQRYRETREFTGMLIRGARALGQRTASGEVESLAEFARAEAALRQAKWDAIQGLRDFGYSWERIGQEVGMSKQAVQQWHKKNTPAA